MLLQPVFDDVEGRVDDEMKPQLIDLRAERPDEEEVVLFSVVSVSGARAERRTRGESYTTADDGDTRDDHLLSVFLALLLTVA